MKTDLLVTLIPLVIAIVVIIVMARKNKRKISIIKESISKNTNSLEEFVLYQMIQNNTFPKDEEYLVCMDDILKLLDVIKEPKGDDIYLMIRDYQQLVRAQAYFYSLYSIKKYKGTIYDAKSSLSNTIFLLKAQLSKFNEEYLNECSERQKSIYMATVTYLESFEKLNPKHFDTIVAKQQFDYATCLLVRQLNFELFRYI